jgi:hypothetical protein
VTLNEGLRRVLDIIECSCLWSVLCTPTADDRSLAYSRLNRTRSGIEVTFSAPC